MARKPDEGSAGAPNGRRAGAYLVAAWALGIMAYYYYDRGYLARLRQIWELVVD